MPAFGRLLSVMLVPLFAVVYAFYAVSLASVIAALYLVVWLPYGVLVHLAGWCYWYPRGQYVLFVYSDSPTEHDYVEKHILPRLAGRAVVLNWSQRRRWKRTVAVFVFRYFGGPRRSVPLAVVFRPFRLARRFRFYRPFHELRRGNTESLTRVESNFRELVEQIARCRSRPSQLR
jgi:hypothetical protein